MLNYDLLRQKPFYLDEEQLEWVKDTQAGLSEKEKIGQLFCLCIRSATAQELDEILETLTPGGVMYRPMNIEEALKLTGLMAQKFNVPPLIAANLEKGGNGVLQEGTMLGSPTQIAATDNVETARRLGEICGCEGAAIGVNWAFAPIIDIDYNFRNPITNTRTFGSEPKRVGDFGEAYVKEVQKQGLAASIKHFPGDGRDERDQHLVTSINDMSCEEWDSTYGNVYRQSIEAGAMTVMIGHIMQPAWQKRLNPSLKDKEILPASLSKELMQGLLREHLGFNGLITTDACTMAGFTIPMSREKAVPYCIAAGADVFLFAKNLEEDFEFMCKGVADGIITKERLDEAVMRILGLKAALNLNKEKPLPGIDVVGCQQHKKWAEECADESITLVKEEEGVLPVNPTRYPRILYYPIESEQGFAYSVKAGVCDSFKAMLVEQGFKVDVFTPATGMEGSAPKFMDTIDNYDLILYFANMSTKSNQTTVRIEWAQPMGANCPHYVETVPTIFVSVENPYHLLDVPRIKTFINCFSSTDETLQAVLNKLTGKSPFKGRNPNDPFCGRWDTRL